MERDQFLARVRAARRGATLPDIAGPVSSPPISFADPVMRFVATAASVGSDVIQADGSEAACREVVRVLRETAPGDPHRYLAWDGLETVVAGIYEAMGSEGWERTDATVGSESRSVDRQRVGEATVGITGADAAIAATGSVVLAHGPGRPRSASLLVEHHIALVPIDRICSSLEDTLAVVDWSSTSNWVAITGPSRTGDIESILTLGVHGPRHLSVILIG